MNKLVKLRKELESHHVDALLITNPYNRRYMTGFTGSSGAALVTKNDAVFITDAEVLEIVQIISR